MTCKTNLMEACERLLGQQCPDMLTSKGRLAVWERRGKLEEAALMQRGGEGLKTGAETGTFRHVLET